MKKFRVEVNEILATFIEIEADSEEKAKDKVQEMYDKEEIVLDYNDFIEANIEVIREVKENE